jgi:cysteine desulfurase
MRAIYLDHHATTPVDPAVAEAMRPYLEERFGNAGQGHAYGREAAAGVASARESIAALLGAEAREIVLTSGATESNNLALLGAARTLGRGHIVVSAIEHASVLEPARALEREGFGLSVVGVPADGIVRVPDVADQLREDTILVSVMAANNEIGTLQPVAPIGALCRTRGLVFHCDAAQAAGRIPIDVAAWGADLVSLSGHKLYGPQGVGALYVRRGGPGPRPRLTPLVHGGGQEGGLRPGTLNVPGIVGLGEACRLARRVLEPDVDEPGRLRALRDHLLARLEAEVGGIAVNGSLESRLPGNLNVSVVGVEAATLLVALADRVALSAASACSEALGQGSHVLRALGLPADRVHTALRFGLGRYNTRAEVDACVETLAREVSARRSRLLGVRVG